MNDNSNALELKYVDQRYDGLEAWVRKGQSEWVRLDFILEYYISGDVKFSSEYRGMLNDEIKAKGYYNSMFTMLTQRISDGYNFEIQEFLNWQRNNPSKINKIRKLL